MTISFAPPVKLHAPSFSVGLLSSTYELRFPPRGSRESESLSPILPIPPVLSFAPVSLSRTRTLAHAHSSLHSRTSQPKKLPSTKFPITHSCLGIYPTLHSFTKHHPHSFLFTFFYNTRPSTPFFPPVIIMCSLFPFVSLLGRYLYFFSAFLLTLSHLNPSHL